MASATAASAAARTITKRAKTWPSIWKAGLKWAKATKLTVAPLSTSSTPMSTPMALRLVAMQTTPQTNSTATRVRWWLRWIIAGASAAAFGPRQVGSADEHDQEVAADDLERQQVAHARPL